MTTRKSNRTKRTRRADRGNSMTATGRKTRTRDHRTPMGIRGFDALVDGGVPQGKCILLSGTPGTGKTIFSLEYIYQGAVRFKEKGLFVSFEEQAENLRAQAAKFGWDYPLLEKQGIVTFLNIPVSEIKQNTVDEIVNFIRKNRIRRLVIDSLSALAINSPTAHVKVTDITAYSIQRFIYSFVNRLKSLREVTSLLISQTQEGQLSRDSVSEFVCDGIITINYEALGGEYSRSLIVRKMREVNNDEDVHPLEISKKGIIIHSLS
ncbi:MAG: AAA family ATPase [DPANN group archaeon]|nr:AAA family ATPase [DPANN group archaeon]